MSAAAELERSILDARDKGDTATLQRLQERYRSEVLTTRVAGPGSITIVERSYSASATGASSAPETGTVPAAVRLRPEAYSTIVNWPHELGFECGGYLAGYESDGEIVVEAVFGADGADPVGEPNRLVLSREWLDVLNDRIESAGWHVVGDCHTHPRAEPQLSATDERGLQGGADAMRQNWIGIVVGRDKDRVGWSDEWLWVKPELRGYLARPGGRSVLPIQLIIEK